MLAAARKVLVTRPGLWAAAAACALLLAIPQALVVTYGAAGGVAFLLTGDTTLAAEIWSRTPGVSPALLAGAAVLVAAGFVVWSRLYAMAIWMSRPGEDVPWRDARRATARSWRKVALLHVQSYVLLWVVAAVLFFGAAAAGPASFGTLVLLAALAFAIGRAIVRIVLGLALRAAVLDGLPSVMSWRTGARFARAARHEVAVTWVGLVAIGVSVWITGRLITPVLQDTAYDYPAASGYELARQGVQLLVSVPLEAALLAFGIAAWTALYDGAEAPAPRRGPRERTTDPWVIRALVAGVVVALLGNGLATVVDSRFRAAGDRAEAAVAADELKPEDVAAPAPPRPPGERTAYDVDAVLAGERLEWTTRIDYLNATDETLRDVGIHVYPNAYTRRLQSIPFGRDLLTSDFNGEFQALAAPGELRVFEVRVGGRDAEADLAGTSTVVDLPRPLEPGERTVLTVDVAMDLPRFPERFGRWEEITLLGNWVPVVAEREDGRWRLDEFGSIGDPFFSTAADYEVSLTADENESVVGTGTLTSVTGGASDTNVWTFEAPAVRDVAFAAGAFLRGLEREAGGVTVRSWYPAGEGVGGRANLEAAASSVTDYTARYGPLPWPEVDVVETEGRLGGMEYPGTVFVSSGSESFAGLPLIPELVSYSGFEEARSRYVVGHEIAHQWWYASAGNDQIREPWLDEALAEASTRLWLAGEEGGERTWLMTNLTAEAPATASAVTSGIDDFTSNETYTEAIYLEGSEVLMELRGAVGAETFDAVLREWHDRTRLGIGTVAGFAGTVREVAGADAAAFLEEYLPSAGG